jgi:hypothetical protein
MTPMNADCDPTARLATTVALDAMSERLSEPQIASLDTIVTTLVE